MARQNQERSIMGKGTLKLGLIGAVTFIVATKLAKRV